MGGGGPLTGNGKTPPGFKVMLGMIAWVPPAAGMCFGEEVRDAAELSLSGTSNAIAFALC